MPAPLYRRILALLPALILAAVYALGRFVPRAPEPERLAIGGSGARGFALAHPERQPFRPWRRRKAFGLSILVLLCLAGAGGALLWQHQVRLRHRTERAAALVAGNPERAPLPMLRFGCVGCHEVSGIPGPRGMVGPTLDGIGRRLYLAGTLPNTPENLVRWIRDPKGVNPKTAMPVTGISEEEARDVAAYLLSR